MPISMRSKKAQKIVDKVIGTPANAKKNNKKKKKVQETIESPHQIQ